MKRKTGLVVLTSLALALSVGAFISAKQVEKEGLVTFATYTNGDAATYYNSIDDSQSGNTLLVALRSLNLSKRQSTVGYSSMGTTPSGQFKYTDYDPNTVQYDSNGQPYGTKISSFYTFTSATSWNREHVWPNSHGGGSGGDAGSPYPDADIHMPRPTISSENSSRGNSFFVEGMNHSSSGWDPYTAGYSAESRGEAARITFYCTLVNSKLVLAPNNTTPSGSDPVTGQSYGSGHTMGNLETLLKWTINYPVNQREKNRNEGAEYLQGNRNPFVDHPEYACKIWGNVNSTTKSLCSSASWDTGTGVTISASNISIAVDGTATLTATASDGSAITWTSSDATVAEVNNGVVTGIGPGTATITATATISGTVYTGTCSVTVSSSGGSGGGDTPISGDTASILYTDLSNGSYPSKATSYTAASGVEFTAMNTANFSSKIQFKKSGGYLYNNSSLDLKSLTLNGLSGSLTVYAGTSKNPSSTAITGSNNTYNLDGYNYFKIINNSASVATCSSITIKLNESGGGEEEEITLSSIALSNETTSYTVGDTFVPPTVTATFSDNSTEVVTENTEFSGYDMSVAGSYTVTATFEYGGVEKTATYSITVNAAPKTLSSISVSTAPTKLSYTVGECFDPTGLVITRTYSDNSTDTYTYAGHTSEFSFTPSTSTSLSLDNTTVTITHNGKSTTQSITVTSSGGGQEESDYTLTSGSPYINGVAYKIYFTKSSDNYYFNGELVSKYYGATSTNKAEGIDVYFEENGSGQNIYMIKNSSRKYFYTVSSNGHVNFKFDSSSAPSQVWTYDSTKETMVYNGDGIGGDSSYNTFTGEKLTYYAKFETVDTTGATAFATVMNDSITCNALGTSAPVLTYSWSFFESVYSNLDEDSVNQLQLDNPSDNIVKDFVRRYDYIVGKYGYADFLQRNPDPIANQLLIASNDFLGNDPMMIVILISAIASLGACTTLILIKKKKNR